MIKEKKCDISVAYINGIHVTIYYIEGAGFSVIQFMTTEGAEVIDYAYGNYTDDIDGLMRIESIYSQMK